MTTIGSHALLLQMATNLVHNAIVHNLPEQGTVWATTSVHARSAVLTVELVTEAESLGLDERDKGRAMWLHEARKLIPELEALGRRTEAPVLHAGLRFARA